MVWRCYLEGANCPVNVITDHAPSPWLASQPTLSHRKPDGQSISKDLNPRGNTVQDVTMWLILSAGVQRFWQQWLTQEPGNLPPPPTNTFSDVGESIRQGYLVDDNFGSDAFVECHGLVKDADFWYKGEQIAVPDVPVCGFAAWI